MVLSTILAKIIIKKLALKVLAGGVLKSSEILMAKNAVDSLGNGNGTLEVGDLIDTISSFF